MVVAVVVALGIWPSWRAAQVMRSSERALAPRPSVVAARLAAAGAPPGVVIGVRHALQHRSGGAAVPVGSAFLGTMLAVIALCGTAVFGASLSHLTATPLLYGDAYQLTLAGVDLGAPADAIVASLERERAVSAITEGFITQTSVNNVEVGAVAITAIRGQPLVSPVDGHVPNGDGQVALGATTMRHTRAHLGSLVRVAVPLPSGGHRTASFRVVSQVSFPGFSGAVSLGTGAAFTVAGFDAVACPPGPGRPACLESEDNAHEGGILVKMHPGPQGEAAIARYLDEYPSLATTPIVPTSLLNFGQAVNFPLIFGIMLAVSGAATLVHLLAVSVARRRHEIGLLKALGFENRQIASVVAWQATTLAVVGILVGVPLGVVIGKAVWIAFANNLGVVPVAVVQIWLLSALSGGVLVVANLLAVLPALAATRSRPGDLLRINKRTS